MSTRIANPDQHITRPLARTAEWIRYAPFTAIYLLALVPPLLEGHQWQEYAPGALLALLVQLVAITAPSLALAKPGLRVGLPIAQIAAVWLLYLAPCEDAIWPMAGLIILPVIALASGPGQVGLGLAIALSLLAQECGGLVAPTADLGTVVSRAIVVPTVTILIAVGVHAAVQRLRTMRDTLSLQHAQLSAISRQRESTLQEMQRFAAGLEGKAHALLSANGVLTDLLDEASGHALVATDESGRVTVFSDGACRLLGIPREEALGASIFELLPPWVIAPALSAAGLSDTADNRRKVVLGSAAAGQTQVHSWLFHEDSDEDQPMQVTVSRQSHGNNGGGYLLVTGELTAAEARAVSSEAFGVVSHELKTPLTGLLGYIDLMQMDETLTDRQADDLDVMSRNARRLLRLVEDLQFNVDLSREGLRLEAEPIELGDLVNRSAALLKTTAMKSGLRLDVDVRGQIPLVADPIRLGQVTDNIVANAVKFTPKGGTVTVTVEPSHNVAGGGVIRISDTGIGIDASEIDHLTERFFRGRTARENHVPGMGLGLRVTKAIVDAHGGTLSLESQVGVGSTVTVELPSGLPAPATVASLT